MPIVSSCNDALASAISVANKVLGTSQNFAIGITPIRKQPGWFLLVVGENRGGSLSTPISIHVRTENVPRHVKRIKVALKRRAKLNPYSDPLVFREDVYGGKGDFSRSWRSVDPRTLTPRKVGNSIIVVPYNPT